jgi:hypothetical protein
MHQIPDSTHRSRRKREQPARIGQVAVARVSITERGVRPARPARLRIAPSATEGGAQDAGLFLPTCLTRNAVALRQKWGCLHTLEHGSQTGQHVSQLGLNLVR